MFGKSRQAYYTRARVQARREREAALVLAPVRRIRSRQPYVGGRKLHRMLHRRGLQIGRDRLFQLLRAHGLLVRRRRRAVRTTDARHGWRTYPNALRHRTTVAPGEVVVADITYLQTRAGPLYLSFVTDLASRKILGYGVHERLTTTGPLRAFRRALPHIPHPARLLHHSDRGTQYCSTAYVTAVRQAQVTLSMTEEQHVYENAVADRVNGILKQECGLGQRLPSRAMARQMVAEAVAIYNRERLHLALDYRTPAEVYQAAA